MSDYENDIPYALQRNPETGKLNGASEAEMSTWREKAIRYRRLRASLKKRLKENELTIRNLIETWDTYTEEEKKAYGNLKMIDVVTTMHYVGKKRAQILLDMAKVSPKRRLKAIISSKTITERFLKVIESK